MHCVREEHSAVNMNLHYVENGTVMLNFIYRKELFFLPLGFALKVRWGEYLFVFDMNRLLGAVSCRCVGDFFLFKYMYMYVTQAFGESMRLEVASSRPARVTYQDPVSPDPHHKQNQTIHGILISPCSILKISCLKYQ